MVSKTRPNRSGAWGGGLVQSGSLGERAAEHFAHLAVPREATWNSCVTEDAHGSNVPHLSRNLLPVHGWLRLFSRSCSIVHRAGATWQFAGIPAAAAAGQAGQVSSPATGRTGGTGPMQYRVVDPATAVAQGQARVVEAPFAPLTAEEQQYIDQVLQVWERAPAKSIPSNASSNAGSTIPTRTRLIRNQSPKAWCAYQVPTKAVSRKRRGSVWPVASPDGGPDYKVNPRLPYGDWWVCDGEWVHQLDRNDKKAVRTQLPPDLRGNNIPLSPLPFLFGVKANEVKARYFIRAIAPPQGNNDVWVEAWPKRADDAGNYSRVQIVLDRSDNLPKAMFLFMPNWSPEAKHRELYEFSASRSTASWIASSKVCFCRISSTPRSGRTGR